MIILKNVFMCLMLCLFLSEYSLAQVSSGQAIKASRFNSSTSQIGEIKQSILNSSQFQSLNGVCWVLMDGQSIVGKELSILTGETSIPDARGLFFRSLDNGKGIDSGRMIGSIQSDDFKQHNHTQDSHQHNGRGRTSDVSFPVSGSQGLATDNGLAINASSAFGSLSRVRPTTGAFDPATPTIHNNGGNETRPKNIAVNYFIKIDSECE